MDNSLCLEALERLVSEESAALRELSAILDREHAALLANDVDALGLAGESRHRQVAALVRVEEERRALCRATNVPATARGLEQLLRRVDPSRALARRWSECVALAESCRHGNDRNGALVAARMRRVEQVLALITRNTAGTYGRRGAGSAVAAGRVIAARA
jgi:flagellar biosynthesis/type III secretory pathway chaperone